jgi:hypothetical protein
LGAAQGGRRLRAGLPSFETCRTRGRVASLELPPAQGFADRKKRKYINAIPPLCPPVCPDPLCLKSFCDFRADTLWRELAGGGAV